MQQHLECCSMFLKSLNDYGPVTLAPVMMKSFEIEYYNTHPHPHPLDYSLALNMIIPDILVSKLVVLGLYSLYLCLDKGLHHPQTTHNLLSLVSTSISSSDSAPVLYKVVYWTHYFTPCTHDCTPAQTTNTIIKFAYDTTVVFGRCPHPKWLKFYLILYKWANEG